MAVDGSQIEIFHHIKKTLFIFFRCNFSSSHFPTSLQVNILTISNDNLLAKTVPVELSLHFLFTIYCPLVVDQVTLAENKV